MQDKCLRASPTRLVGVLSTWNSRCGIAEYSKLLSGEFSNGYQFKILAPKTDILIGTDDENVLRCWNCNDDAKALIDNLGRYQFDALIIQYNDGFLTKEEVSTIVETCRNRGTKIILILHSLSDLKKWGRAGVNLFRRLDRVLVHSQSDLQYLKTVGLNANATTLPHGLLPLSNYEKNTVQLSNEIVLGSYGFILPNKGLHKLIVALSLLRRKGINAHLKLINSLYPADISGEVLRLCRLLVEKYELSKQVFFESRFLPHHTALQMLSTCDCIVYAYQKTDQSASGAVRQGLASGRPVLCTPLSIFSDVQDVV